MAPEVVAFGEPMFEFNAMGPGALHEVQGFRPGFGGDTSNFAVAVARLGRSAGYVCSIGDDGPGEALRELWRTEGVDFSRVKVDGTRSTGLYFITHDEKGEHRFTYVRRGSAASRFEPEHMDADYVGRARVFHFSGITQAIGPGSREAARRGAEMIRQRGGWVTYDPNLRTALWPLAEARKTILDTLGYVDVVLPSLEEARLLTGLDDPWEIARSLGERGPKIVALKLGEDGCIVAARAEVQRSGPPDDGPGDGADPGAGLAPGGAAVEIHVPAWPVRVQDAAGAGDAFDGGFVVGLLEGWSLERTARFANAVGALTAAGQGCVEPIPRRAEVERFMAGGIANE